MSEHDDIRRALEELSSDPPQRDRKPGVRERIAVVRRRRQIGGGIALSVVTLLTGITLTSLPRGNREPDSGVLTQSTTPTPTPPPRPTPGPPSSAAPKPDSRAIEVLKPTGAPNIAAPATPALPPVQPSLATVTKTAETTVTATAAAANPPPISSPPPASPTAAARPSATESATPSAKPTPSVAPTPSASGTVASTSPSGSAGVIPSGPADDERLLGEISADTIQDGSPAPETVVKVRVHGTIRGSIDNLTVWFTKVHRVGYADTQARRCQLGDGTLRDIDETFTFRTRYRAAGAEQIEAVTTTLDQTCVRESTEWKWSFNTTYTVPVGSTLSNGVQPVTLTLGPADIQASKVAVSANADDPDGNVSGFTVFWESGQAQSFPGGNGANCTASEGGGMFWPDGSGSGRFTSPDLSPGTHTVTVIATSTGCDGKDAQSAKQTLTVTVP